MSNFRHVITQAYREILKREPDPGGLEAWNAQMNAGTTEAQMREAFLRSDEYRTNFPEAPPVPVPTPGGPMSLRVQGNQFVNPNGAVVRLQGIVSCCPNQDGACIGTQEAGWPSVNRDWINFVASRHHNAGVVRLGPFVSSLVHPEGETNNVIAYAQIGGPTGKYDLTQWASGFWQARAAEVGYAMEKGVYLLISLIDTWALQHRCCPWNADFNLQGWEGADLSVMRSPLMSYHEAFVRQVVRTLGGYSNVLWEDGNESFKGTSRAWLTSLRDVIRDEEKKVGHPARPIGTNAQTEDLERVVDYGIWHERSWPAVADYPRITNEYDDIADPDSLLQQIRGAWATEGRVSFFYWRGESHSCEQQEHVIAETEKLILGQVGTGIPDTCPPLARLGLRIYAVMDRGFQLFPEPEGGWNAFAMKNPLPAGTTHVKCDMTPRFGGGNGRPCNEEHNEACGGRACEDPRGGLWSLLQGDTTKPLSLDSNDFQCTVHTGNSGHYMLRVMPKPGARDRYGRPLDVSQGAAKGSTVEWDIQ